MNMDFNNLFLSKIDCANNTLTIKNDGKYFHFNMGEFSQDEELHFQIERQIKLKDKSNLKKNICEFMISEKIFNMCDVPHINLNDTLDKNSFKVKLLFLDKQNEIVELIPFIDGKECGDIGVFTIDTIMSSIDNVIKILSGSLEKNEKYSSKKNETTIIKKNDFFNFIN